MNTDRQDSLPHELGTKYEALNYTKYKDKYITPKRLNKYVDNIDDCQNCIDTKKQVTRQSLSSGEVIDFW